MGLGRRGGGSTYDITIHQHEVYQKIMWGKGVIRIVVVAAEQ